MVSDGKDVFEKGWYNEKNSGYSYTDRRHHIVCCGNDSITENEIQCTVKHIDNRWGGWPDDYFPGRKAWTSCVWIDNCRLYSGCGRDNNNCPQKGQRVSIKKK